MLPGRDGTGIEILMSWGVRRTAVQKFVVACEQTNCWLFTWSGCGDRPEGWVGQWQQQGCKWRSKQVLEIFCGSLRSLYFSGGSDSHWRMLTRKITKLLLCCIIEISLWLSSVCFWLFSVINKTATNPRWHISNCLIRTYLLEWSFWTRKQADTLKAFKFYCHISFQKVSTDFSCQQQYQSSPSFLKHLN